MRFLVIIFLVASVGQVCAGTIKCDNTQVGDIVTLVADSAKSVRFELAKEHFGKRAAVNWLEVNHDDATAKVIALPQKDDIQLNVKEHMIVELYNK